MLNGTWYNPTKIIFGRDSELSVGAEVAKYSHRILLHYGGDTVRRLGLLDKVVQSLNDAGVNFIEFAGVQANPRAELIYRGIELCRQKNIDFILAVGGGSVIDSAKVIALGVPYHGDFYDFTQSMRPVEALKVATVLTIPGAGSESSPAAVINHEDKGQKLTYVTPLIIPVFSILNPSYTTSLSPFLTSAGIVDAISHVLERYFTNTPNVDTTDQLGEALIRTLMDQAMRVQDQPDNYDIRAEIMWACKLAHDDTVGFGRKQDWACHGIAHEIAVVLDSVHGATMAVIFPAWMQFLAKRKPKRLVQFAENIMGVTHRKDPQATIRSGVERYKNFLKRIGMPTHLKELGLKDKHRIKTIAQKSVQYMQSGTLGNFFRLEPAAIAKILEIAY